MNIAANILYLARLNPDRLALVHGTSSTTYGVLARGLVTTCAKLRELGLPEGAIVAIQMRNPIQHVALILALEICGMTSLSVQTRYSIDQAGLRVDALLIDAGGEADPARRTVSVGEDWFALAPVLDHSLRGGVPDDRYYRIILSSGTTGFQKAIGYKPPLVARYVARAGLMAGEGANSVVGMLGFSTLGFFSPIRAIASGGTAYFAGSAEEALYIIRLYSIERLGYIGVALLEALVAAARGTSGGFPSLKVIQVSGAKVPPDLAGEALARLCPNIVTSYGSTEAGIMSFGRLGAPGMVEGAAGYVLPWVDMQTIAADGEKLRPGAEGLLQVKSPDLAEYVLPPGASGQIDQKGWFHTGDVGYVRADGMLVVTGRSSEVFNRRGIIVAPDYIEAALRAQPRVREAAAFLHLDAAGQDEIWAAVVADGPLDLAELRENCRPALGDKTPDRLERVEALPRTETGKIKRGALRERFATAPQR